MTRPPLRVDELLREMRSSVAPVGSPDDVRNRRNRTIEALREAQVRVRADRRTAGVERRYALVAAALLVPSVAAAAAFAVYVGGRAPGGAVVHAQPARSMSIRALEGHVDVIHQGRSTEAQPGHGTSLDTGDAIHTAGASFATISLPSGASVQAGPLSNLALSVPEAEHRETIELALGRVDVSVPKLPAGSTLSVQTPDAKVTVHGTRFSVVVVPAGDRALETDVAVSEGIVTVEHDGRAEELRAGGAWSSVGSRANPEAMREAPPADAVREEAAPKPTRSDVSLRDRGASPVAVKSGKLPVSAGKSEASFGDQRSSTLSEENALMERAMVSSRNGDDRGAIALLNTLVTRYPGSVLKENALVERFRALRRLGDVSAASREAQHYLAEHPEGSGRDEAERLAVESTAPRATP